MLSGFLNRPVLIVVVAVMLGSCVDALVKGVAPEAGLAHLLAWRFAFASMISVPLFLRSSAPRPNVEAIRFHTVRGIVQLAAAFSFFYALTQLGLAEATIYGFTAALMVPVLASVMLKEPMSRLAVIATLIGFAGAVLTVGTGAPSTVAEGNRTLGLIAVFAAAFLYALVLILLRMRARSEDALTIVMFTNVVPAVFMLPVLFGLFGAPNWSDLPSFALLGFLGFGVWYLMTLGYARAPAQRLAPLEYTAIVWSSLLGALVFAEIPTWNVYLGGAVIICACLMVAYEDHRSSHPDQS